MPPDIGTDPSSRHVLPVAHHGPELDAVINAVRQHSRTIAAHLTGLKEAQQTALVIKYVTVFTTDNDTWTVTVAEASLDANGAPSTAVPPDPVRVLGPMPSPGAAGILLDAGRGRRLLLGSLRTSNAWATYVSAQLGGTGNGSLGNGSLVGHYTTDGSTCQWRLVWQVGSTTTLPTGGIGFNLPPPPAANDVLQVVAHGAIIPAAGTARWPVVGWHEVGDGVAMSRMTYQGGTVAQGAPATLVAGDRIALAGVYEVA